MSYDHCMGYACMDFKDTSAWRGHGMSTTGKAEHGTNKAGIAPLCCSLDVMDRDGE